MERLREGLDSISPAVFVHVMDSLFVRRGSASAMIFDPPWQDAVLNLLHFAALPSNLSSECLRAPNSGAAAAAAAASARADAEARAAGVYDDGGGSLGLPAKSRVLLLNHTVMATLDLDSPAALPAVAAVLRTPGAPEALLRAGLLPSVRPGRGGGGGPPSPDWSDPFWPFVRLAHFISSTAERVGDGSLQLDAAGHAALAEWAPALSRVDGLLIDVICARLTQGAARAEPAAQLAALLLRFCDASQPAAPLGGTLVARAPGLLLVLSEHAHHPAATSATQALVWRATATLLSSECRALVVAKCARDLAKHALAFLGRPARWGAAAGAAAAAGREDLTHAANLATALNAACKALWQVARSDLEAVSGGRLPGSCVAAVPGAAAALVAGARAWLAAARAGGDALEKTGRANGSGADG
ncbi:hypothetical protein MNEG_3747 [Monoraphidium neglectum]|uniref:Uncharacterized protein n=1 Tax=Monoraphidium neglectum TaxID=145388 RepID=A0A0D2MND7_9CHLO|nr:hypothetical protein MNEG_3747 [Monoraphidium neglectum]KIZ04205.1 hypothetical protein MNEG_3747 [Monoraphidium neglectum]|eukprot:XP_013903224.1 hypothetical protein MNEG_3747 [Monoraphidium neglectum]